MENSYETSRTPAEMPIQSTDVSVDERLSIFHQIYNIDEKHPVEDNKPEKFAPEWVYGNLQELAVNCRKLFFIYLALLGYAVISALTTPVQDLFLEQEITLPLFSLEIPMKHYLIFTPVFAICFFVYIQVHLCKVNRLIEYANKRCREINQKCAYLSSEEEDCRKNKECPHNKNRLYPWILIFSRYSEDKLIRGLQILFVNLTLWALLPFTLWILCLFVIRKHDDTVFVIIFSVANLGTLIVYLFLLYQKDPSRKFYSKLIRYKFIVAAQLIALSLMALSITYVYLQAKGGELIDGNMEIWSGDLNWYEKTIRYFSFVNLTGRQIANLGSAQDKNALILNNAHFEGANLSFCNMNSMNLNNVSLKNASIINGYLVGSSLESASLHHCDLVDSDVTNASFNNAKLQYSNFQFADLKGANFKGANIYFADFRFASNIDPEKMKEAHFWQFAFYPETILIKLGLPKNHNSNLLNRYFDRYKFSKWSFAFLPFQDIILNRFNFNGANFDYSVLRRANFDESIFNNASLKSANLLYASLNRSKFESADLTNANLAGVTLVGSDLTHAILDGANFQWADLRGTYGISDNELRKSKCYKFAYLDQNLIKSLKLPYNHNERLKSRDFSELTILPDDIGVEGLDFSGANFEDSDLKGLMLRDANLENAILRRADLSKCDLTRASLIGAQMDQCNLNKANLIWVNLTNTKGLKASQVIHAHGYQLAYYDSNLIDALNLPKNHNSRIKSNFLQGYDLSSANLRRAELNGSDLSGADLTNAILQKAILIKADLSEARLHGADLRHAELNGSDLNGANLTNTILKNANLTNANLSGAKLDRTNVEGTSFKEANLQYADLKKIRYLIPNQVISAKNAKLAYYSDVMATVLDLPIDHNDRVKVKDFHGYHFNEDNLKNADLHQANLQAASFVNADLSDANLSKANLTGADLTGANLKGATFCETYLKEANLQGADLRGIQGCEDKPLDIMMFKDVRTLYEAKIDEPLEKRLQAKFPQQFEDPKKEQQAGKKI